MSAHAEEIFDCACHDPAHTMRFSLWKDSSGPDLVVTVHLTPKPFLQRVWQALRYVIGRNLPYGHFEEALLQVEDMSRLKRLLDEFEQANHETSETKHRKS